MLKLKLQYFGHVMQKNWLIWKDLDARKDWKWEEKGMTEDEMVGWHHWLNGHEFEQAPGVAMDMDAWRAAVHGVSKSQTWLSNWTDIYKKNSSFQVLRPSGQSDNDGASP